MGSGPVSAVLSPPFAVDGESLRKREDKGVGDALGETGEKVHACRGGTVKEDKALY